VPFKACYMKLHLFIDVDMHSKDKGFAVLWSHRFTL